MAALRLQLLQFTVLMWLSKSGVILHRVEELGHLVEPLIDTNAVVHAWCKEDRAKGPCSLAAALIPFLVERYQDGLEIFRIAAKMGEDSKRQTFLALAKLAEQAERYEGEPVALFCPPLRAGALCRPARPVPGAE